jgi:hypothetical protein
VGEVIAASQPEYLLYILGTPGQNDKLWTSPAQGTHGIKITAISLGYYRVIRNIVRTEDVNQLIIY